jgi:hypothetical protein
MRIHDLIKENDQNIQIGDSFSIEYDGFLLESTVIDLLSDGPVIAIDDVGLAYIPTEELEEGWKSKLAGAALAATAALGGMSGAQARVTPTDDSGTTMSAAQQMAANPDFKPSVSQPSGGKLVGSELAQLDKDESGRSRLDKVQSPEGNTQWYATYNDKKYRVVVINPDDPQPRLSPSLTRIAIPAIVTGSRSIAPVTGAISGDYIYVKTGSTNEAKYQGRTVPLGKPMHGDVKKSKVYVKDPSTGNIKKVNFGDKKLSIKKHLPGRRKSFRARHNCDNPGPRTKARYWSCRAW